MGTPVTQILQRPAFGTRTRPIDRSGSDLELGCATRSLQAEADRAQVLAASPGRFALLPAPTSLAPSDAGARRSGYATGVEMDLIDVVLRAERSAAAYLELHAAGMTAGCSMSSSTGAGSGLAAGRCQASSGQRPEAREKKSKPRKAAGKKD